MNKVKFNLKNVHYAPLTFEPDGAPTYGTPVRIPGAVSLSLEPEGDSTPFHADGVVYYTTTANNGYSGDIEFALIPEGFSTDILGFTKSDDGVIVENSTVEPKPFALLFQFDGDQKEILHTLYNCTAARPGISSKTSEDSKEVQTETLSITAAPLTDGRVKAKTGDEADAEIRNNWFKEVYTGQKTEQVN